jgi:hypothetical protein
MARADIHVGAGQRRLVLGDSCQCGNLRTDKPRPQKFVEFRTPSATYWRIVSLRPGKVDPCALTTKPPLTSRSVAVSR